MRRKLLLFLLLLLLPLQADAARLFVASNSDKIVYPGVSRWITQISFSVWIYATTWPVVPGVVFGENGGSSTTYRYNYAVYLNGITQRIEFAYQSGTGGTPVIQADNLTISTGAWHHVAVTFDNSTNPDTCVIYLDGVSKTTSAPGDNGGPPSSSGGQPRIGNDRPSR